MLPGLIAAFLILAAVVSWIILMQRRLVMLDENVNSAINQIGMQLSGRFDALTALLNLTKSYAEQENEALIEEVESARRLITAGSTPDDLFRQESVISEVLSGLSQVAERHPEIKTNRTYIKTMDAVQTYKNMMRTSLLIYNDNVSKLNRKIRMFPVSVIAGMLGFHQREYLVERAGKAEHMNT